MYFVAVDSDAIEMRCLHEMPFCGEDGLHGNEDAMQVFDPSLLALVASNSRLYLNRVQSGEVVREEEQPPSSKPADTILIYVPGYGTTFLDKTNLSVFVWTARA